jgi:hypothetical protein
VLQGIQAVTVSVSHLSGNTNAVPHSSTTEAQYTCTITHNMPYVVTLCPATGEGASHAPPHWPGERVAPSRRHLLGWVTLRSRRKRE